MTLNISISSQAETTLKAKASAAGVDVETFAAQCLERIAAPRSVAEISGPIAGEFARTGMSEDELGNYLEDEKHQMRRERRMKAGQ